MRFLAVSGSLRKLSTNAALLRAFARHAPDGHIVALFHHLGEIPPFNPDGEPHTPPSVLGFAEQVARSDGVIIAAPEYAHGIPGVLKNALDWLVSRDEIPNKPVMLVHASSRSAISREHLREVLRTMSVRLYPEREFELHLIGKSPDKAELLLGEEQTVIGIATALRDFGRFIALPQSGAVLRQLQLRSHLARSAP